MRMFSDISLSLNLIRGVKKREKGKKGILMAAIQIIKGKKKKLAK